jgi:Trk K+ transport system NAD-binding subunit/nucleotide-binding universal stress UspA family protein
MKTMKEGDSLPAEEENSKSRRRVFIVGLGQSGRELVLRLQDAFDVVAVDVNNEKVEILRATAKEEVKALVKDGTSRITWQKLGLCSEDLVVAVTRRDDVNLEVCRVAGEYFGVKRRFATANTLARLEEFHQAGIETISRPHVIAASIGSLILQEYKPAVNIGLGAGEIVEVQVLKTSAIVGKKLKSFRAQPWLVAAVYREGKLIVPHGDTIIREGDRVVLVGDPQILPTVADFFRIGEAEFPLQFGTRIALVLWTGAPPEPSSLLDESAYVIEHSRARGMLVVSPPGAAPEQIDLAKKACEQAKQRCAMLPFVEARSMGLSQLLEARDAGCLVLSYPGLGFFHRLGFRKHFFIQLLEEGEIPLLVARGSFPYKRILLPVEISSQPVRAAEVAIDLARLFNAQLEAVTVTPPVFSVGKEKVEEQKQVLTQVERLCSLYRVPVRVHHLEGNPIHEVVNLASEFQLVMIGYGQRRKRGLPGLDLSLEIMHRAPCSVMMLPYSGEAG